MISYNIAKHLTCSTNIIRQSFVAPYTKLKLFSTQNNIEPKRSIQPVQILKPSVSNTITHTENYNYGLKKFMGRVYATSGLGIGTGLTVATVASQMPFVAENPLAVLGVGFVGCIGSIFAFSSIKPKIIKDKTIEHEGKTYTINISENSGGRIASYGLICGSMGIMISPMVHMATIVSPSIMPMAIGLSLSTMIGSSLYAYLRPPGSLLSWGPPLITCLSGFVGMGLISIGSQ
jgi:FtsH-binding integral membrane protein